MNNRSNIERYRNCHFKWYYEIVGLNPPSLIVRIGSARALPNSSYKDYRRLVWGTDNVGVSDPIPEPELLDPFTVTVKGEVVFRMKSRKWVAIAMRNTLIKKP